MLRDSLLGLSKDQILSLVKSLNNGSIGFDHERARKAQIVEYLLGADLGIARPDGTTSVYRRSWTDDDVQGALAGAPGVTTGTVAAREGAATTAPVDQTAIAAQIGALFASIAASAVSEDKVRAIVQTEVSSALERSPVVRIEVVRPDGSTHTPTGHVRPEFADILLDASVGLNILLVGPAGSGKTHLAHQIAEALGRPFASVSCTAGMSESVLSGWLLPVEGGAFEYVESDFVRLYEGGGVFTFDEVDAADPNTLLFINQALANGSFFLPQRKGRTLVKRHAEFVCIGIGNTFGNGANGTYAGRERLDEAFLDRFRAGRHFVDYDVTFERAAVDPELLAWGWAVRKRIAELRMQRVMSTRFLLDATKSMKAGATFDRIKAKFFLDWKSEDRQKVELA